MARAKRKSGFRHRAGIHQNGVEKPGTGHPWGIATLIFFAFAAALLLKAYEERRSSDQALVGIQAREAFAIGEFAHSRIQATRGALKGAEKGIRISRDAGMPMLNGAFSLSASRSRLTPDQLDAARLVETMVANKQVSATLNSGHVVVLGAPDGKGWAAIVPATALLPAVKAGERLGFKANGVSVGFGDTWLSSTLDGAGAKPGLRVDEAFRRVAYACAPVGQTGLTACSVKDVQWITLADVHRLLIYLLLFAAPAFGAFGLNQALNRLALETENAENRRDEMERRLSLALEGAGSGLWDWTAETDTALLTEQAGALMGGPSGRMTLDQMMSLVASQHRNQVRNALVSAGDSGNIDVAFHPVSGNGTRWLKLRGRVNRVGRSTRVSGIVIDVSDQKHADARIQEAERRLREAIEAYTAPFAIWDTRRRLVHYNRSFVSCFGLETGSLRTGASYEQIMSDAAHAIRSENPSSSDTRAREVHLIDGRWLNLVERHTADGAIILVGVDISAAKKHEELLVRDEKSLRKTLDQLQRSEGQNRELARKYNEEKIRAEEASRAKSAFLANMSHELRTPLNAVLGFSEMMEKEVFGPLGNSNYNDYAKSIHESGQHLLDLINDILDMAKIEAGKMSIATRQIDPSEAVDAAVRMLRNRAEEKNIKLVFADEQLPEIEADHRAVKQMVLNLLSNAIKFTDAGGTVSVETAIVDGFLRIGVRDTGIGIPEKDLTRIGKPFEQVQNDHDRNYSGTGLGLALTTSFAEMHGGRLDIESELGVGTFVSFLLPLPGTEPLVQTSKASMAEGDGSGTEDGLLNTDEAGSDLLVAPADKASRSTDMDTRAVPSFLRRA